MVAGKGRVGSCVRVARLRGQDGWVGDSPVPALSYAVADTSHTLMSKAWAVFILLFGIGCAIPWTGDPRIALTDWSPPAGTISYVELASRFAPWKRSSLGLACGSDHHLRLVFRSRLPGPRLVFEQGNTDNATIFLRDIAHKLEVPILLTEVGQIDTFLSEPLSLPQLKSLATSIGSTRPETVNLMTMETGTFMKGRANNAAVQKVVSACT